RQCTREANWGNSLNCPARKHLRSIKAAQALNNTTGPGPLGVVSALDSLAWVGAVRAAQATDKTSRSLLAYRSDLKTSPNIWSIVRCGSIPAFSTLQILRRSSPRFLVSSGYSIFLFP